MQWAAHTAAELAKPGAMPPVVVLPVGSLEQHGPHLTVDTDTYLVHTVACRAAERVSPNPRVLILPPLWTGFSAHHLAFGGTVSVKSETLIAVVYDICSSLIKQGYPRILVLNGHGGNVPHLQTAAARIRESLGGLPVVASYFDGLTTVFEAVCSERPADIGHAGEAETSMMLACDPTRVRHEVLVSLPPVPRQVHPSGVFLFRSFTELTPSGYVGAPSRATREKGNALLEAAVRRVADVLRWMVDQPV